MNKNVLEKKWRFGYFVERDPSLKRDHYSTLYGPYSDYIGHLNSHYDMNMDYCPFCKILTQEALT